MVYVDYLNFPYFYFSLFCLILQDSCFSLVFTFYLKFLLSILRKERILNSFLKEFYAQLLSIAFNLNFLVLAFVFYPLTFMFPAFYLTGSSAFMFFIYPGFIFNLLSLLFSCYKIFLISLVLVFPFLLCCSWGFTLTKIIFFRLKCYFILLSFFSLNFIFNLPLKFLLCLYNFT